MGVCEAPSSFFASADCNSTMGMARRFLAKPLPAFHSAAVLLCTSDPTLRGKLAEVKVLPCTSDQRPETLYLSKPFPGLPSY